MQMLPTAGAHFDPFRASDAVVHSTSSFTAESSRRSENLDIPPQMAHFGRPSNYSLHTQMPAMPAVPPVRSPPSTAQFVDGRHHWQHLPQQGIYSGDYNMQRSYTSGLRDLAQSGAQGGRYQPGSVSADQSAFEFQSRQLGAQYQHPAPGAASDAFSRYTKHPVMQQMPGALISAAAAGYAGRNAAQAGQFFAQAARGHATSHPPPPGRGSEQHVASHSIRSNPTALQSSMNSYDQTSVRSFYGLGLGSDEPYGTQDSLRSMQSPPIAAAAAHGAVPIAAAFSHTASTAQTPDSHAKQRIPSASQTPAGPRSGSPLSLTKREKAAAERDTLPPQFRGSRVLSFQPTESRWLTVYTEYKTRRQVRLYGSSAVSACLRRDFERIRSGIKPRINGRGRCTWLTLVDRDMFSAFCTWRSQLNAANQTISAGEASDNLLWTGPTPDEMDAAASRMGVSLSMKNWREVCKSAEQYRTTSRAPPGQVV